MTYQIFFFLGIGEEKSPFPTLNFNIKRDKSPAREPGTDLSGGGVGYEGKLKFLDPIRKFFQKNVEDLLLFSRKIMCYTLPQPSKIIYIYL